MNNPEITLSVPDMTCGHCAMVITKTLAAAGVPKPGIDLKAQKVSLTADEAELPSILEALAAEGYPATKA